MNSKRIDHTLIPCGIVFTTLTVKIAAPVSVFCWLHLHILEEFLAPKLTICIRHYFDMLAYRLVSISAYSPPPRPRSFMPVASTMFTVGLASYYWCVTTEREHWNLSGVNKNKHGHRLDGLLDVHGYTKWNDPSDKSEKHSEEHTSRILPRTGRRAFCRRWPQHHHEWITCAHY